MCVPPKIRFIFKRGPRFLIICQVFSSEKSNKFNSIKCCTITIQRDVTDSLQKDKSLVFTQETSKAYK